MLHIFHKAELLHLLWRRKLKKSWHVELPGLVDKLPVWDLDERKRVEGIKGVFPSPLSLSSFQSSSAESSLLSSTLSLKFVVNTKYYHFLLIPHHVLQQTASGSESNTKVYIFNLKFVLGHILNIK